MEKQQIKLLTLRAFRLGLAHGLSHAMGLGLVVVVGVVVVVVVFSDLESADLKGNLHQKGGRKGDFRSSKRRF